MNLEELHGVLDAIAYKPHWGFACEAIGESAFGFRAWTQTDCVDDGASFKLYGKLRIVEDWSTIDRVVISAFEAVRELEMHQAGEHFRFRGVKVFDPHRLMEPQS